MAYFRILISEKPILKFSYNHQYSWLDFTSKTGIICIPSQRNKAPMAAFEDTYLFKKQQKLLIANNIFDGQNDDYGTQK